MDNLQSFTPEYADSLKLDMMHDSEDYFNIDAQNHHERLKEWCEANWPTFFVRERDKRQRITFHECCFCFTRKTFTSGSGHPQTANVVFYPGLESQDLKTPTDLYDWLIRRIRFHQKAKLPLIFPRINITHHRRYVRLEWSPEDDETELLNKRVNELKTQVTGLTKQSSTLKLSCRHWYDSFVNLTDAYNLVIKPLDPGPMLPPSPKSHASSQMSSEEDLT